MEKRAKPHGIRDLAVFGGYNRAMNSAALAEENRTLKAALAARDGRIEYLEFEMAKLKQMVFGARSERLATLPDPAQLPLWAEQPEDAPLASPVEFKTVVKSPAKGKPKRTALPEHLPREIVVLPLSAEDRQCPEAGRNGRSSATKVPNGWTTSPHSSRWWRPGAKSAPARSARGS